MFPLGLFGFVLFPSALLGIGLLLANVRLGPTLTKNSFDYKIVEAMVSKIIDSSTIYLKIIGHDISLIKKLNFPQVVSNYFIRND